MMTMRSIFINKVISYSLAYHAADVMDDDNFAVTLTAHVQINDALIAMVRKTINSDNSLDEAVRDNHTDPPFIVKTIQN